MNINTEILAKANQKLKEKEYYNTCPKAKVCPSCGGTLKITEIWEDGGIDYNCGNCGEKFSILEDSN